MSISIEQVVKRGWEIFKSRPWLFVGVTLLIAILYVAAGVIANAVDAALFGAPQMPMPGEMPEPHPFAEMLKGVFSILISMGAIAFFLKAFDDPQRVGFEALWHPKPFLSYLAVSILVGLAVAIGLILFVIPGIIFYLMFMFAPIVVVDRDAGPIEAMKISREITAGNRWTLLGLAVVLWLINLVGVIALGVGLLVSIPVTVLATIAAYRQLGGARPQIRADAGL